jgi:hypothetical protein
MPGITQRMLTKQLAALEDDKLIDPHRLCRSAAARRIPLSANRREPAAGDRHPESWGEAIGNDCPADPIPKPCNCPIARLRYRPFDFSAALPRDYIRRGFTRF